MRGYITINLRQDLAPHPLDPEIRELARQLRRLVHRRATDLKVAAKRGKPQTPEHIAKRVAAVKGRKRTPEQCENIAASLRGRTLSPKHVENVKRARCRKNVIIPRDPIELLIFGGAA